jgi:hypothetical protein
LELTLFRCEPLAMAQGIEAVLRNGGLGESRGDRFFLIKLNQGVSQASVSTTA